MPAVRKKRENEMVFAAPGYVFATFITMLTHSFPTHT